MAYQSLSLYSISSSGGTFNIDYNNVPDLIWLKTSTDAPITLASDVIISSINQAAPVSAFYVYVKALDYDLNGHSFTLLGNDITQSQLDAGFLAYFHEADSALTVTYPGISNMTMLYTYGATDVIDATVLINTSVTFEKLQNLQRGNILVGNSSNRPTQLPSYTNGNILVGDGSDLNSVAVSGDVTLTSAGVVTVGSNKISNSKLAQMASNTVKANITGSTANPSDVSINTLLASFGWRLIGNSGTTPGTHFIGTTDNQDLVFKTNSIESGRINISNYNTFFGRESGLLTTGSYLTGIGEATLTGSSGDYSIGIGYLAGGGNTGDSLVAIGNSAGDTNSGIRVVAIGGLSGQNNTYDNVTLVGYNTEATGDGAIALGKDATAQANEFAIPNGVTKIKWRGVSYTLPATDGTAGQALKTDGSGILYWG